MTDLNTSIVQDLARAAAEDALGSIVRRARLATGDLQIAIVASALSMVEVKRQAMLAGLSGPVGETLAELHDRIIADRLLLETATLQRDLSQAGVA